MLKHFIICVDGAFWFQIPNQKFSTLQIVFTFSFSSKLWFHIESERRNPAHPELMECIDCIPFVLYQYLYYGFNFPKIHFQYSDCCAQHAIKYSNMYDVCLCVDGAENSVIFTVTHKSDGVENLLFSFLALFTIALLCFLQICLICKAFCQTVFSIFSSFYRILYRNWY